MIKLFREEMIVTGDPEYGWTARYENDPNSVWGMNKDVVIQFCKERYEAYLKGELYRGVTGYWSK